VVALFSYSEALRLSGFVAFDGYARCFRATLLVRGGITIINDTISNTLGIVGARSVVQ